MANLSLTITPYCMLTYQEHKPIQPALTPYVESYVHISGQGPVPTKTIHPHPGATVVLDFNGSFSGGGARFTNALSGLRSEGYRCQSWSAYTDRVLIRFSPYGLSRFTSIPVFELTNQVMELRDIWGSQLPSGSNRQVKLLTFQTASPGWKPFCCNAFCALPQRISLFFGRLIPCGILRETVRFPT